MTLGNMRELGVRSLAVTCELCHHEAVLRADRWGDAVPVRAFRPRMVCTACVVVGADARPPVVRLSFDSSHADQSRDRRDVPLH